MGLRNRVARGLANQPTGRRRYIFLLFVLAFMPIAIGQSGHASKASARADSASENAVRQLLSEQQGAWNRHDLESFMQGYWKSPELTFFSSSGVTRGWDATLQRYRTRYQSEGKEMGTLDFYDVSVDVLGPEAALVRGHWKLKFSDGKEAGGVYTLIVRKFDEGWRIVHDHTS